MDNLVERSCIFFMQNLFMPDTPFMQGLSYSQVIDFKLTYTVIHRKQPVLTITTKHIYKQLS